MSQDQSYYHYNKKLKNTAKILRKNMTKAEAALWKYGLRKKQRSGYTFNRQRPVLDYVVDFMCKALKLIVEVDGSSHDHEQAYRKDRERQAKLERAGYYIIRFTNEDVLENMDSVCLKIDQVIEEIESGRHGDCPP